jgi:hypothetical protein
MKSIVSLLAKVTLRQEDELAALRAEWSYVIHLHTDQWMPAALFQASAAWKKKKEEGTLTMSLRQTLFMLLMLETSDRLEKVVLQEEMKSKLVELHQIRLNPQDSALTGISWVYQDWDEKDKMLKANGLTPISHVELVGALKSLRELASKEAMIHRFHATRKLAEQYKSESLVFLLTIACRSEGQQMHQMMEKICGCAATSIIGMRVRRDRGKRSPLSQVLQRVALEHLPQGQ